MGSFGAYLRKRILLSIFVIFAVSVLAFLIIHLVPGDPVRVMLGVEADEAFVQRIRSELNLDKPLAVQYWLWIRDVFRGKLGRSLILNADIGALIARQLPVTLSLTVPALAIATILGIIIGIVCATSRGSFLDQALTAVMAALNGVPVFWIGIMLMYLFGVVLKWLPLMGYTSPFDDFRGYLAKAAMPVAIIAIGPLSAVARQVRTNMLEIINQDYIRTARACGLPEGRVKYKYGLKNALIPVATLLALQVRSVVGGSLLAEQLFSIAGMSQLIMISVLNKDYLVIQATVFVITIIVVFCNLLLDISYGWMDPRVRLTFGKGN
jgi:peptide/nickel transport system permease protein